MSCRTGLWWSRGLLALSLVVGGCLETLHLLTDESAERVFGLDSLITSDTINVGHRLGKNENTGWNYLQGAWPARVELG